MKGNKKIYNICLFLLSSIFSISWKQVKWFGTRKLIFSVAQFTLSFIRLFHMWPFLCIAQWIDKQKWFFKCNVKGNSNRIGFGKIKCKSCDRFELTIVWILLGILSLRFQCVILYLFVTACVLGFKNAFGIWMYDAKCLWINKKL